MRIAQCFVTEEDFDELRRVSVDPPSHFAANYHDHIEQLNKFCAEVRDQGGIPVKVYIKPAELVSWCRAAGRDVDANARADYALHCLLKSESHGGDHK